MGNSSNGNYSTNTEAPPQPLHFQNSMSEISARVLELRERMGAAALRCGRHSDEITLVAVTKRVDSVRIMQAREAGIADFGENYYQEAREKLGIFGPEVRWHFIGHLQSNKAKHIAGRFETIQSVDSLELAKEIGKRALHAGKRQKALIEVKLDPGDTKFGILPEDTLTFALQAAEIDGIDLQGLMGMPPFEAAGELARPYFAGLRRLFDALPPQYRRILSMGMTSDFETAIEEGSTMIRVGTAIFGPRRS
jgi:pyridoxal phosphate enzyme (YggS family)